MAMKTKYITEQRKRRIKFYDKHRKLSRIK